MSDVFDWKLRIVELVRIKQAIDDLDTKHLWEYRLPAVAATESELRAVEDHLGEALDPEYRAFLQCAGGWPAFYQMVDLFGPADLLGGPRFQQALTMLGYVEEAVLNSAGLRRQDLLPIAATPVDLDLFVMTRHSSLQPGCVIWLAGYVVDRFPSFGEYFLAMTEYNQLEIQDLRAASEKPTDEM